MSILVRLLLLPLVLAGLCFAQSDLSELNLEQLGQVKVTSASKKSENLSTAPAAIYVLTGEAIGATSPFATSQPGIFAVGDVRAGSVKRVASSVGEGSVVISKVWEHVRS